MRLLLDTHISLWAIGKRARLSPQARDLIADPANTIVVSTASVWEIAIKHALARGRADAIKISGKDALSHFEGSGYEILPITPQHVIAVAGLPFLHKDPFDRLLVAQAHVETLRLLTSDRQMAAYGAGIMLI